MQFFFHKILSYKNKQALGKSSQRNNLLYKQKRPTSVNDAICTE